MTTAADPAVLTRDEVLAMNEDELMELIDLHELDVDPDDFESDLEGLRTAVASALGPTTGTGTAGAPTDDQEDTDQPLLTGIWRARDYLAAAVVSIVALVAVAQLLPTLVPVFGPSVNAQLTELRATTKALTVTTARLDEIVILGELTSETTDDTGQTVQVRGPSLVTQMQTVQSDLVLARNTANEANRQSRANSDAVAVLQTADAAQDEQIHRAASSRSALAKKTEAVEAQVTSLGNRFNTLADSVKEARATARWARTVANRAEDKADTLAFRVAGLDQRTSALEAVNMFLYAGNDSLLTLAVGNGSVAPEIVAGLEAGQRAVNKYRRKK